jgi:iron complex transport system substrate-binding protein
MKRAVFYLSLIFFLSSCSSTSDRRVKKTAIIAKDCFGRELKIPVGPDRIIPLFYIQAEMICVLGEAGKIVGIGKLLSRNSPLINEYFPQLHKLPQVGNVNINYEKIVALKPDIVFCGLNKAIATRLELLNINTLATFPQNPMQIADQILLYGRILERPENSMKIADFLSREFELVANRTKLLSEKERPKIYYARTDLLTTLGSGINSDIIYITGGINVARNLPEDIDGIKVSIENLYEWNPDIIIVRDRAFITPEEIMNDERFRGINAVKNRKVFQETYGWTEFRIGMYFGMIEKAKWLHPELFQDLEPRREYERFVKLFQSFGQ